MGLQLMLKEFECSLRANDKCQLVELLVKIKANDVVIKGLIKHGGITELCREYFLHWRSYSLESSPGW